MEEEYRTAKDVWKEIVKNRAEGDKLFFELWRMYQPKEKSK